MDNKGWPVSITSLITCDTVGFKTKSQSLWHCCRAYVIAMNMDLILYPNFAKRGYVSNQFICS